MSEMRQRTADPHREIRGESRAAVLGMFDISHMQSDAGHYREDAVRSQTT